jgi:hypothetical protein
MDTLLCKDDGAIVFGTNEPSNALLRLSAYQYTTGSATWADQSGNGLDFTVSTNALMGLMEVQHVDQIYPHQHLGHIPYFV